MKEKMSAIVFMLSAGVASAQTPSVEPAAEPQEVKKDPYWELVGGYEGDTHGTGYGFLGPHYTHPLKPGLALSTRVHATYLRYDFENGLGGDTEVRQPGVSAAVGLKFGTGTTFKISAGPNIRRRRETIHSATGVVSEASETRVGVGLGADLYYNATRRTNIHALGHYGTDDGYVWSRLGVKRQVGNLDWQGKHTLYLGGEGIGQGNEDIRSWQLGALAEVLFVPSRLSLMFRGGYKRSSFDIGADRSGPYFGVGLYKRF